MFDCFFLGFRILYNFEIILKFIGDFFFFNCNERGVYCFFNNRGIKFRVIVVVIIVIY